MSRRERRRPPPSDRADDRGKAVVIADGELHLIRDVRWAASAPYNLTTVTDAAPFQDFVAHKSREAATAHIERLSTVFDVRDGSRVARDA